MHLYNRLKTDKVVGNVVGAGSIFFQFGFVGRVELVARVEHLRSKSMPLMMLESIA